MCMLSPPFVYRAVWRERSIALFLPEGSDFECKIQPIHLWVKSTNKGRPLQARKQWSLQGGGPR